MLPQQYMECKVSFLRLLQCLIFQLCRPLDSVFRIRPDPKLFGLKDRIRVRN